MGLSKKRIRHLMAESDAALLKQLSKIEPQPELAAANFSAMDEKRTTIRMAVDHLYAQTTASKRFTKLPDGAPFGQINVDRKGCTLCMACVSVCPASALSDGGDLPQLSFTEWNCVQCGLCETACPEQVITRAPRFVYDAELRRTARILNEDKVFSCVSCGKPFSTQRMMDQMASKLSGHWMFQKPEAVRRLHMCEDCRVKDMFTRDGGMMDVHNKH
jgi:ferredoxin